MSRTVDILAHEYGWTVPEIFGLSLDEINLLLDRIVERKKAEADAISGKKRRYSGDRESSIKVSSDADLAKIETLFPGSVVNE